MASRTKPISTLAELEPGVLKSVEIDGEPILLARFGETVCAVGGICPHAGAPLAEGVLDGEQVICPWHKAAFSLKSGRCTEPPAVDDLARYDVELRDGKVWLGTKQPPRQPLPKPDSRTLVILGSGAAGANAAQTLRAEGFSGRVVLIGREPDLPYDRTILSKYMLSGESGDEKSPLQTAQFYRKHRIERLTGEVTALDANARTLTLADGKTLSYDAAMIATGGIPRPLDIPGGALGRVFLLRSKRDAKRIAAAAEKAKRAVVIGSGFIGMEAAASLRERGLDVTVIAPEKVPMERQFGAAVGRAIAHLHEEKGVRLELGRKVARLEGSRSVQQVVTEDGATFEADLVVVGLGISLATSFLSGVDLGEDGSVPVDAGLKAADGLYAAGDIARFPARGDGEPIRVEHWRVAEQHGRLAARAMLGQPASYDSVPVFWTIQYREQLTYIGHAASDDAVTVRGTPSKRDFLAYYHRDGKVTAVAGMGRDQDTSALVALMEAEHDWTVDALHPPRSSPAAVLKARQS